MLAIKKDHILPQRYLKMSQADIIEAIKKRKLFYKEKLLILAHHYQKDEIVNLADSVGDSLELAKIAKANQTAEHIIFCGVHFMAETADMLSNNHQKVYLPDAMAGCSMADMATLKQLEIAWSRLSDKIVGNIMPITYINSSAAVKAFVGDHQGVIVTSGNAEKILKRALNDNKTVLFLPDQHLGRNTAYHLGVKLDEMAVWQPKREQLIMSEKQSEIKVILWQGRCCVHQQYTTNQIKALRQLIPDLRVIVHPECPLEVVLAADDYGSTKKIIDVISQSPKGSKWAIGTDNNLVNRLINKLPEHQIVSLNPSAFSCLTMNRIHLAHLLWTMDEIEIGSERQVIKVNSEIAKSSLKALDRMLG